MATDKDDKVLVGVLAIQGAFIEHVKMLVKAAEQLKCESRVHVVEVREPGQLAELAGLVIPGGESTTMSLFFGKNQFGELLKSWTKKGAVLGTCAGLILLSNQLEGQKEGGQVIIGGLDITTSRNSFGRQVDSFEATLKLNDPALHSNQSLTTIGSHAPLTTSQCAVQPDEYHGIFLRSPRILSIDKPEVQVLATLKNGETSAPVAVRQNNLMATCFHPELTTDTRWHCYFLKMCMTM